MKGREEQLGDTNRVQWRPKVFLSYSFQDRDVASRIADTLERRLVDVSLGLLDQHTLAAGESIVELIEKAIRSSDYLVVLLSPESIKSRWIQYELATAFQGDLQPRGITLLPVLIEDCEIPSGLSRYQYLDWRDRIEEGVAELAQQLESVSDIAFSRLDYKGFEDLVADLLRARGFRNIQRHADIAGQHDFDMVAQYSRQDPFGATVTELWLVEVKFYRNARAGLSTVHQLVEYVSSSPLTNRALLVTSGFLTSAARDFLHSAELSRRAEVRVIDAAELKRLLVQEPDLVRRYFRQDEPHQDE